MPRSYTDKAELASVVCAFRLTPAEHEKLGKLAYVDRRTISNYVRALVVRELEGKEKSA